MIAEENKYNYDYGNEYVKCTPIENDILKILKSNNVMNPCFNNFKEMFFSFYDIIIFDSKNNKNEISNYANIMKSIILQLLRKLAAESIFTNIFGNS